MTNFNNVNRSCRGNDRDSKSEQESSPHELPNTRATDGGTLNDRSNDNGQSTEEHANFSTPRVDSWPDEWNGDNASNLVH